MSNRVVLPYVKVHVHKLDDVRFIKLPISAIGRWTQLMILARRCDAGGALIQNGSPMKVEDIALIFRCAKEELATDLKVLRQANLIHSNGRGLQLNDFDEEQGPDDEVKRAYWRERQRINREKSKRQVNDSTIHVNDNPPTESESESESDKTNIESDKTRQDESKIPLAQVLKALAIPKKYHTLILGRPDLSCALILSAYVKAARDPKIKSPAAISGWKLANREDPEPTWWDPKIWKEIIPIDLLRKIGIINGDEKKEDTSDVSGYTQSNETETEKIMSKVKVDKSVKLSCTAGGSFEMCWKQVLTQLSLEMPEASFRTWVRDTIAAKWDQETLTLTVAAPSDYATKWLKERLTAKAQRLLQGICAQRINLAFATADKEE